MEHDPITGLTMAVERLTSQLDKQNTKIDEISKEMRLLIANQIEIKELRESLGRSYKRLEAVEHNQNTDGCQAHKNFLDVRKEQVKHFESLAKECQENHDELETRIKILEDKPLKAIDKFSMAIIGALGVGFGGWILLKIGVQTK